MAQGLVALLIFVALISLSLASTLPKSFGDYNGGPVNFHKMQKLLNYTDKLARDFVTELTGHEHSHDTRSSSKNQAPEVAAQHDSGSSSHESHSHENEQGYGPSGGGCGYSGGSINNYVQPQQQQYYVQPPQQQYYPYYQQYQNYYPQYYPRPAYGNGGSGCGGGCNGGGCGSNSGYGNYGGYGNNNNGFNMLGFPNLFAGLYGKKK
uniref:Uncharacterized protein n=1 Tax=Acrobeloides nanus TaxID=290746 RepID=A0A914DTD9_9BILA